jgi:hypothetical protein
MLHADAVLRCTVGAEQLLKNMTERWDNALSLSLSLSLSLVRARSLSRATSEVSHTRMPRSLAAAASPSRLRFGWLLHARSCKDRLLAC